MKLYEEFKDYENMWDTDLKESYVKTFEGKDYDLTSERQLRELIDAIVQKELGIKVSLSGMRESVISRLILQLKHEKVDPKIINVLIDLSING